MSAAHGDEVNPLGRFSDRVEDYVRYRPGYPAELIGWLRERAGMGKGSRVADVGAGTGIFSGLLLEAGATVFAVEPNDAMRSAAEAAFRGHENFRSVNGTAEATGLDSHSVSLVTCAQAFHWFDPAKTRREFVRILTPGGWCAVIWNTANPGLGEFAAGYERIKGEFGTDFRQIRHEAMAKTDRFDEFFGAGRWEKRTFPNHQTLDFEGLKGRLQSSSYSPKPDHPRHSAMIAALGELFDHCQRNGVIRMEYDTEVFAGRLSGAG